MGLPASSFPGNPRKSVLNTGPINFRALETDFAGCPYKLTLWQGEYTA
jgi:hypothetical protein